VITKSAVPPMVMLKSIGNRWAWKMLCCPGVVPGGGTAEGSRSVQGWRECGQSRTQGKRRDPTGTRRNVPYGTSSRSHALVAGQPSQFSRARPMRFCEA